MKNFEFKYLLALLIWIAEVHSLQKEEAEIEGRTFSNTNIQSAITNLTGSYFLFKALLIYWIHLAFQTVGWALSSAVWNSLRPGVNSLDPDIPGSITDGLINGDFSATNLALGAGQWVFYFLVWGGILLLYSGSSTAQARSGEADTRPVSRGDFELGQDGFMRALDDLFSPSTIAKQNVINILGALGGTVWVTLLSYLPDSDQNGKKRTLESSASDGFWRTVTSDQQDWVYDFNSIKY